MSEDTEYSYKCRFCGALEPSIYLWELNWVKRDIYKVVFETDLNGDILPEAEDYGEIETVTDADDPKQEWWCDACETSTDSLDKLIEKVNV